MQRFLTAAVAYDRCAWMASCSSGTRYGGEGACRADAVG